MKNFFSGLGNIVGNGMGWIGSLFALLFVGGILWYSISSNMIPARAVPMHSDPIVVGQGGYVGVAMLVEADNTEIKLGYDPGTFLYSKPTAFTVKVNEVHDITCEAMFTAHIDTAQECVIKGVNGGDYVWFWINVEGTQQGLEIPEIQVYVNGHPKDYLPITLNVFAK